MPTMTTRYYVRSTLLRVMVASGVPGVAHGILHVSTNKNYAIKQDTITRDNGVRLCIGTWAYLWGAICHLSISWYEQLLLHSEESLKLLTEESSTTDGISAYGS